jgi:serine/threonine protein phosphatase PrpC
MHMITNPSSRDHAEVDLGPAAGVSDKGLRHHRNEDAMALSAEQAPDGPAVVAVVCDGVSSSARPDEASQAASQAALPLLVDAVRAGNDLAVASRASVTAARQAVADLQGPAGDTSATTFVSAVANSYEVTLCWLGDSRAYWLAGPGEDSRLLTLDDSVAGGMVAAGLANEAAAMASPHAHVLTRWLGGDAADLADDPDRAPHVQTFTPPGAGALLICSDGLWNYRPEAGKLAALALPKALADPLGAAADMVKFAIDAGGADNITAVLIPYLGPETPEPGPADGTEDTDVTEPSAGS